MTTLFILSLFKQGYKIKLSTLLHLLKGKRTISVLMNGFLYGNLPFFQLFPELTDKKFSAVLQQAAAEGFLTVDGESLEAEITDKGRNYLKLHSSELVDFSSWIDGYRYGKADKQIWRLLQFFVQVASQLSYQNSVYVPLESSPYYQWKIKHLLGKIDRGTIGRQVGEEFTEVFNQLSREESQFFALQFSGFGWNGKTEQQLLDSYPLFQPDLSRKNAYHHLFKVIESLGNVPVLNQIVQAEVKNANNQSMLHTKKLWLSGVSPEKIAEIRRMKQSTVNDHLLELAIQNPDYPFEQLLSKQLFGFFKTAPASCQDWAFQSMKDEFAELDYFSYRMGQILTLHKERGL